MGMFMNQYDPQYSTYLLDVRDEATISKLNQSGIYENDLRNITSSIIGFWLNDKIIIGNPESYKEHVDYIYTKHTLNLSLIKQIGEFKMLCKRFSFFSRFGIKNKSNQPPFGSMATLTSFLRNLFPFK